MVCRASSGRRVPRAGGAARPGGAGGRCVPGGRDPGPGGRGGDRRGDGAAGGVSATTADPVMLIDDTREDMGAGCVAGAVWAVVFWAVVLGAVAYVIWGVGPVPLLPTVNFSIRRPPRTTQIRFAGSRPRAETVIG